MARDIHTSSAGVFTGAQFADKTAGHLNTFYDAMAAPVTGAIGSNTLTGTVNADFIGNGLQVGQRASWTQPVTNTGVVTLALNGGSAVPVVDSSGAALISGALPAGLRVFAEYAASKWHILSVISSGAAAGQPRYHDQFISSGTWTKPTGLSDDTLVTVLLRGAGGGGGSAAESGGGGGGGGAISLFRLGDLPSAAAVTVPSGGAINANGGNTTFGTLLTAWGGGKGSGNNAGGGGGGMYSAAVSASPGSGGGDPTAVVHALNLLGGGAGGGAAGGNAYYGGGGGGGSGVATGGASVVSGNGGANGVAGTAPGGGGGRQAAGARGQADIFI